MADSKFNLRQLFVAVSGIAICAAALKYANSLWASAISTGVVLVLFTAVVAAIYLKQPKRAFWTGFAIFGWGYLILIDGWLPFPPFSASTMLIWMMSESLGHTQVDPNTAYYMETPMGIIRARPTEQFFRISYSITAMLLGVIGGILARRFYLSSICNPVMPGKETPSTDGRS